jgi:hypothetical protein
VQGSGGAFAVPGEAVTAIAKPSEATTTAILSTSRG